MRQHFILTAVGRDRPGIVADLAEMVFDLGCNLEDSSMMNLGSEFATMVLLSGLGEDLGTRLHLACKHLEYERDMVIFIKPVEEGAGPASPPEGRPFRLRTMGEDKAGIVARTARAIAGAGGNILQLASHLR
ncbi:MAG TPA: ACT domain-containing protein, partial [Candidatus Polarisedimenticolia bacterium]|nr:ACT domain-containing protein [Candidatus Polarisedimenticolia bacterium]